MPINHKLLEKEVKPNDTPFTIICDKEMQKPIQGIFA